MGGHDNGLALCLQVQQKVRHHLGGQNIQTVCGFVENNDIGVMYQRDGKGCLLLHTGGQIAYLYFGKFINAETLKQKLFSLLSALRIHAV